MLRSARDGPWSNYRATSGMAAAPQVLAIDWIVSQLDSTQEHAIQTYRRFVKQRRGTSAWDELTAGILLGSEAFVERMRPLPLDTPLWIRTFFAVSEMQPDQAFNSCSPPFPTERHVTNASTRPFVTITTSFARSGNTSAFLSRRSASSRSGSPKHREFEDKALPPIAS
jgi:hypothetical protein